MNAKVHQYPTELRNTKKENRPINEYLLRIKALVDQLAAIGSTVTEQEHIRCVLEGLPQEYGPFVTSVNLISKPVSVTELHSLLIAQEIQLAKYLKPVESAVTANIVIEVVPNG